MVFENTALSNSQESSKNLAGKGKNTLKKSESSIEVIKKSKKPKTKKKFFPGGV